VLLSTSSKLELTLLHLIVKEELPFIMRLGGYKEAEMVKEEVIFIFKTVLNV
jgi:hypothetical protein